MKSITKAAIAGAVGVALLVGGAGTLSYWNDTKTGSSVVIASGNLALGSIVDGTGWTLQQNAPNTPVAEATGVAYTGQLVVPGDTLTTTVNVPITLTGENIKATFSVTDAVSPVNALASSLTATIVSVNGVAAATTATLTASGTVPVVYKIVIPWNLSVDNTNKSLSTNFQASYTLTQVAEAS